MKIKKINSDYIIGLLVFVLFMLICFYNLSLIIDIESRLYKLGSGYVKTGDDGYNKVIVININDMKAPDEDQMPIPGNKITELIESLNNKGAKFIGLTIPPVNENLNPAFKEIKKLSARVNAYPPADRSPGFKEWILQNLSDIENNLGSDTRLADVMKRGNNVIIPVNTGNIRAGNLPDSPELSSEYFLNGSNIASSFHEKVKADGLIFPDDRLLKNSLGFGHIVSTHNGSIENSYQVFLSHRGNLVPSLPLRMALAYLNIKPSQILAGEQELLLNDNPLPLINGLLYDPVKDRKDGELRTYSYSEIMKTDAAAIKEKVIFIGLDSSVHSDSDEPGDSISGLLAAKQFMSIININAVTRPFYMVYAESFLLFILIFTFVIVQAEKGFLKKSFYAFLILVFIIGISFLCFSLLGIWFKAQHIIYGILAIYLCMIIKGGQSKKISRESAETIRLLGLNFQSQGNLDKAFEKFRELPLDKESMDLIYNLGLEYEKKKLIEKALEVYKYINKGGGFRDLDDRIPRLRESEDQSSTMGSYGRSDDPGIIADTQGGKRTMVGRYKILSELGKGSMGLVYKAQDPKINRFVAIKTIKFSDEFDEDVIEDIKERFFMEAEIAGKLSHPSIVTILDVGDDQDLTYMAMEYLEGEDLEKFIIKEKLLPIREVLDIIYNIAEALDFAHEAGVIHRDIKPANVMLLEDNRVKVTDFGIAKAISSSKTKTGVILGTPNYMSPEQIMGQKINSKSDIFSLGVLFYQLLTGELPFHGENLSGLLYQITQVKHASPREYNKKIPKVCEQIIDKALMKDPEKRFKKAGDMARVIKALADKIDELRMKKSSVT